MGTELDLGYPSNVKMTLEAAGLGSWFCSSSDPALPYVVHDGRDGCRVNGSLSLEGLDVIQSCGVKQLDNRAHH